MIWHFNIKAGVNALHSDEYCKTTTVVSILEGYRHISTNGCRLTEDLVVVHLNIQFAFVLFNVYHSLTAATAMVFNSIRKVCSWLPEQWRHPPLSYWQGQTCSPPAAWRRSHRRSDLSRPATASHCERTPVDRRETETERGGGEKLMCNLLPIVLLRPGGRNTRWPAPWRRKRWWCRGLPYSSWRWWFETSPAPLCPTEGHTHKRRMRQCVPTAEQPSFYIKHCSLIWYSEHWYSRRLLSM